MLQDPRITFFPKRRVRVELTDWAPKRNAQGEKRVRLDFTIPLLNEAREGEIPAWLLHPLDTMELPDSVQKKTKLEVELEGVTLELWDTPKSAKRAKLLTAATLSDFYLVEVTRDKETCPALTFCTNVPRTDMLEFCDRYEGCWLWSNFTPVDASKISPPVPGAQMTIADGKAAAAGAGQSEGEAQANAEAFLRGSGGTVKNDPMPHKDPEAAERVREIPHPGRGSKGKGTKGPGVQ